MPTPRLSQRLPRRLLSPRTRYRCCPSARFFSSSSSPSATPTLDPRTELEHTLVELRKHASSYTNLSRLQLALQGLQQQPGAETIRLAVLGLGADGARDAKDVLRLLLADPLSDAQAWERALVEEGHVSDPVIVRVGAGADEVLSLARPSMLQVLRAETPVLRDRSVEVLAMQANMPEQAAAATPDEVEEAMLVPMVDIPAATGRYFPVRTPVHCALLFASGIAGAVKVCALPRVSDSVAGVVDLVGYTRSEADKELPFVAVDLALADEAVALFRKGPQHALEYDRLWRKSNMPALVSWLKLTVPPRGASTTPAVRQLVTSLLSNTQARVAAEEPHQAALRLQAQAAVVTPAASPLDESGVVAQALGEWAQKAHSELQDQLEAAFLGKRWRMLRWWKLFWKVDDVAALTGDILASRFLPTAEQELVYLAGRIEQARGDVPLYVQPVLPTVAETAKPGQKPTSMPEKPVVLKADADAAAPALSPPPTTQPPQQSQTVSTARWPQHISFTRAHLATTTVPALQALAQKLVLEAYMTSALATSLGGLVWASSSLYEAGAVAGLGVVWGVLRMQRRWDAARAFWEGEVREEGRKALRAAERSVGGVLERELGRVGGGVEERRDPAAEERRRVLTIVEKARVALERMR